MLINIFRVARTIDPITAMALFLGSLTGVILILYLSDIIIDLITYKQTAKTEELKRRITFNPLKHFSIFGIIMLLIVGITFTKQRPYTEYDFIDRKKGLTIRGITGLSFYLLSALLGAFLLYISFNVGKISLIKGNNIVNFLVLFYYSFCINIFTISFFMFIFNCIPVFPQYSFDIIDAQLSYQTRQKPGYLKFKNIGIFVAIIFLYIILSVSNTGIFTIIQNLIGNNKLF